jgi:hypothetical protein
MRQRLDGAIARRRSGSGTEGDQNRLGEHLRSYQPQMRVAMQRAEITTVGLLLRRTPMISWCAMGGVMRWDTDGSPRWSRQRHRDPGGKESDRDKRGERLMRGLTKPVEAHVPNLALYVAMATPMAARAAAAFSNPRVSVWVPSRSL